MSSSPYTEVAVFTRTMRDKDQVIYHGQPYILDKEVPLKSGSLKRIWRCNQWWRQKCRARIYTVGGSVWPMKNLHTHQDVVKRKKRVVAVKQTSSSRHQAN